MMIDCITKNDKILLNTPNYVIFSSNKNSNRSSNNRSKQQQTPTNSNGSEPKPFKIRTFTSRGTIGKSTRIEGKRITQ